MFNMLPVCGTRCVYIENGNTVLHATMKTSTKILKDHFPDYRQLSVSVSYDFFIALGSVGFTVTPSFQLHFIS